jgi:hypothetical protein
MAGVQTVLRSQNAGNTWQNIGSRTQMSRGCELTINPTNSNEIYVTTSSNPPTDPSVPSYVLEHTLNGGISWETIRPIVHAPGMNITPAWLGTQLSIAGNRLYSLLSLPIPTMPTPTGHQGQLPTTWVRLMMSTDGGHNWNALDTQFYKTWQSARTYTINPNNPTTVYELVGLPAATPGGLPNAELYKSVDGGLSWHPLLTQIGVSPSPIKILIGNQHSSVVYLINTACPVSSTTQAAQKSQAQPLGGGMLNVCLSNNGGTSWATLAAPTQLTASMSGGMLDQQGRLYTQATTYTQNTPDPIEIWRYNPMTTQWNKMAQAPDPAYALVGVSAGSYGTTNLWLISTSDQPTLSRYITKQ